jgi:hypothetical protein
MKERGMIMGFYFSKSKFVASCVHCNKYAWLDKNKPEEKSPVDEMTLALFANGHKVGELAKEYFHTDVDVTSITEDGKLDLSRMLEETEKHMKLGTKVIAEASFSFGGFFCSVDILVRNDDGTYNMYEVKSSKQDTSKNKKLGCVKEKYIIDASYQQYVLTNCGVKVDKVFVVLLSEDYVRGKEFELDKYFVLCDVTEHTDSRQGMVEDKLKEVGMVLADTKEPKTEYCKGCNHCDYWAYCSRHIQSPSPFDVYDLNFNTKCELYNQGVSFWEVPEHVIKLKDAAARQIEYYNREDDVYIDENAIKSFFEDLKYPIYSLDFETYQQVVPEYEGVGTYGQVPFQYSLHVVENLDADIDVESGVIKEYSYLNLSGNDTRREIAESLVQNIPYGAQVIAYHESTERNIIARLAKCFPDLGGHLLSFTYKDPLPIFENGQYYVKAMGKSFSLKSVAPALYPNDKDMDYHNLEGDVKNGTQAMNVYLQINEYSDEEKKKIEEDLKKYCALDTLSVVKILKKLHDISMS